jgi:lysophospholipase L1-like esterase
MRLRLVLLLVIGSIAVAVVVKRWQAESPYQARLAQQLAADPAAPAGAVVLLGDSILVGLDATAVAPGALNYGIGGDTTRGLLDRVGRYRSLGGAHAIFLEIGINDLLHGKGGDVVTNYRRILAALPKQPRLYLIGILPIDPRAFAAAYGNHASNAEIERLDATAAELCRGRGNCVPLQPFGTGSLPADDHIGDGLHLNDAGYRVLAAALKAALAEP